MNEMTTYQKDALNLLHVDKGGMVNFGELARNVLGMQAQYASYYVDGIGVPRCADDLRMETGTIGGNYHAYRIHVKDAPVFIERVNSFQS